MADVDMNYVKPVVGDVNLPFLYFGTEKGNLVCGQPGWATAFMLLAGIMILMTPLVMYGMLGGYGFIQHLMPVKRGWEDWVFWGIAFVVVSIWGHIVYFCFDKVIGNRKIVVDADGTIHLYQGFNRRKPYKSIRWHEIELLKLDVVTSESTTRSGTSRTTIKKIYPAIFLTVKNQKPMVLCVGGSKNDIRAFYEEIQKRTHKAA